MAFTVENGKSEDHYLILHIRITLSTFLDQVCPEREFLVENRKSEHHH